MNRTQLVIKLFNPDENGVSRWVSKEECVGEYGDLYPTNGNQWYRNRGLSHFIFKKQIFNGVTHWKFDGLNDNSVNRSISNFIRNIIIKLSCAHTGFKGTNNNMIIVDHKNGRYDDKEVLNINTQKIEHFQPLNNQSNLKKRSDCNKCIKTNNRFDAKELGYSVSVIDGTLSYEGTCYGCYWHDCVEFKKKLNNF